jgi:hypothetical protein
MVVAPRHLKRTRACPSLRPSASGAPTWPRGGRCARHRWWCWTPSAS